MTGIDQEILQDIDKQYYLGTGMPRNYGLAEHCFRAAANGGDAVAQYWLGKMYDERKVKEQNENRCRQKARNWYRQSAEQNFADAQLELGKIYYEGRGVNEDAMDAYKWFALAAANGSEDAGEKIDELEKRMSPEDVAKAQAPAIYKWYKMHQNVAE